MNYRRMPITHSSLKALLSIFVLLFRGMPCVLLYAYPMPSKKIKKK